MNVPNSADSVAESLVPPHHPLDDRVGTAGDTPTVTASRKADLKAIHTPKALDSSQPVGATMHRCGWTNCESQTATHTRSDQWRKFPRSEVTSLGAPYEEICVAGLGRVAWPLAEGVHGTVWAVATGAGVRGRDFRHPRRLPRLLKDSVN